MRVFAALVLILAVVLIGMAARGDFGPAASPAVRATARAASTAATAVPTASGPRTITVTLTEQELTKAAQGYMPMTVSGITVTDPNIKLEPGRLTLTATGRAFIVGGPIVVVASPLVSNGTAAAKIESATFAGLNLPDSTKQNVADTFARVLAANIPSGVRVTSLTVNAGTLVIEALPN
ncbi:MAG TPA: LmeA family phospholipid-binding protein [Candidatus Limnocylindria bacterium]